MSESIAGLRETLEDSEDESDEHLVEEKTRFDQTDQPIPLDVPMLSSIVRHQGYRPPTLTFTMSIQLLKIFKDREVVHLLAVLASLQRARSSSKLTASNIALEYAMYWMAPCTLTDNETSELRFGPQDDLLRSCRNAVENSLHLQASWKIPT